MADARSGSTDGPLGIALWIVQVLLALTFVGTGLWKLATPVACLATMIPWARQVPHGLLCATAVFDLLGGLGVLLPSATRIKPGLTTPAGVIRCRRNAHCANRPRVGGEPVRWRAQSLCASYTPRTVRPSTLRARCLTRRPTASFPRSIAPRSRPSCSARGATPRRVAPTTYLRFVAWILAGIGVASVCVAVVGLWGVVIAAVLVLAYVRWRTARPPSGLKLRVEDGTLLLPDARIALDDLLDVELESKAAQTVSLQLPVGAAMLSSSVGPGFDASRLVFVLLDGATERRVPMTRTYAPKYHGTEWLGRVRVFLRKHGWVADDEIDDAPAAGSPGRDAGAAG